MRGRGRFGGAARGEGFVWGNAGRLLAGKSEGEGVQYPLVDAAHQAMGVGGEILAPKGVGGGVDALKVHAEVGAPLPLQGVDGAVQQVLHDPFAAVLPPGRKRR